MRRIRLLCVGNIKKSYFSDAINEYAKRLSRFCDFKIIELPEYSGNDGIKREAEHITKSLVGTVILFDRQGIQPTSEEFAAIINKSYISGRDTITLIIGGSNGVADSVRELSNTIISFGKVTYPHRLMRVIATEQIYRAFSLLENLPYHK